MTETLTLERQPSEPSGTFGVLLRDGEQLAVTCEPEKPIPAGTYVCAPHSGPKYKNVWQLLNVPGRTAILIHNGNTINDTRGCILVGSTFGRVDGLDAVVDSKATLNRLRATLPKTFRLEITEP